MKKTILFAILTIALFSCTENEQAKRWGGTADLTLPRGQKLLNVTWKEDNLWYLTRPMTATDSAVTYTFQEKSNYGLQEGTFIIYESK
jgi:hypothetical protein